MMAKEIVPHRNVRHPSGWYFRAWRGQTRWVGEAKRAPFVTAGSILEPGDVWFEYGDTALDAILAVQRDVGICR